MVNLTQIGSHAGAFLIGAITGAAGKYLADKYTDRRRYKESAVNLRRNFINVASAMPELIQEIQRDLQREELKVVRDLYILPSKRVVFNLSGKYFVYYEDEHDDLQHKFKRLEDYGFVRDVTCTNTPKYRMSDEFVNYVKEVKIKGKTFKI
jgi:uncharacterized protein YlbG (UPF0298 family)